jgi:hypothetical protein
MCALFAYFDTKACFSLASRFPALFRCCVVTRFCFSRIVCILWLLRCREDVFPQVLVITRMKCTCRQPSSFRIRDKNSPVSPGCTFATPCIPQKLCYDVNVTNVSLSLSHYIRKST